MQRIRLPCSRRSKIREKGIFITGYGGMPYPENRQEGKSMGKKLRNFCRNVNANRKLALFMAVLVGLTGVLPFAGHDSLKKVQAAELILEDAAVSAPPFCMDNFVLKPGLYEHYNIYYYGGRPFNLNTASAGGYQDGCKVNFAACDDAWGTSIWGAENSGQTLLDNTAALITEFSAAEQGAMSTEAVTVGGGGLGNVSAKLFPLSSSDSVTRDFTYWLRDYVKGSDGEHYGAVQPASSNKTSRGYVHVANSILPAFRLDLTKAYMTVKAGSVTVQPNNQEQLFFKFMVADDEGNSLTSAISGKKIVKALAGETYAVPYADVNTESGAGEKKFISAVIYNSSGKIMQYSRLAGAGKTSGVANLTIPSELSVGETYILALFEETENEGYKTNYCSTPVYASLELTEEPVQTGIHADFDGQVCEGKDILKSGFTVTPQMSSGPAADRYAQEDFHIIKTEDYHNLDASVLSDEALFLQSEGVDAVTADMLAEGEETGTESVTVTVFTGEASRPYYTTEVDVRIKARGAEDDLLDQYGSWEALAAKIKELEKKLHDAEELRDAYKASVENIQGQLDSETARNQTLQETLADIQKEKDSLQNQYDALEDQSSKQAQTIRDQIAALQDREDRIAALQNQIQEIQKDITALQNEVLENNNAYKEILLKVNELLAEDEKLDGTGSDNAGLKTLILSGLGTVKEKIAGLQESLSRLKTSLNGLAAALEDALAAAGIDISAISSTGTLTGTTDAETYEHMLAAVEKLLEKIKDSKTEADGYRQSLATALEQITVIKEQLDSEKANSQSLQNQLDRLNAEKEALQNQYDSLDDLNSEQAEQIAAQIRELEEKEAALSELQAQNRNLTDALDSLQAEKKSLQDQYDALEDKESAQAKELQEKIREITAKEKELEDLKKQMELIQGNIHSLQDEVNGYSAYFAELLEKINGLLREDQKIDGTGSSNAELKIKIAAGIALVKENLEEVSACLNGTARELETSLKDAGIDFSDIAADGKLTGETDRETCQNIAAAVKKLSQEYKKIKADYETVKKAVLGSLPDGELDDRDIADILREIEKLKENINSVTDEIQKALDGEEVTEENRKDFSRLLDEIRRMKEELDASRELLKSIRILLGVEADGQVPDAIRSLIAQVDALGRENAGLKEEISGLKNSDGSLKEENRKLRDENAKLEKENNLLKENGAGGGISSAEEKELRKKIEELTAKNQDLTGKNASLAAENKVLADSLGAGSKVPDLSKQIATLTETNSSLAGQVKELTSKNSILESENRTLREENSTLREKIRELTGANSTSAEKIRELTGANSTLTEKNIDLKGRIQTLTKKNSSAGDLNSSLKRENKTLSGSLTSLNKKNSTLKKNYSSLLEKYHTLKQKHLTAENTNKVLSSQLTTLKQTKTGTVSQAGQTAAGSTVSAVPAVRTQTTANTADTEAPGSLGVEITAKKEKEASHDKESGKNKEETDSIKAYRTEEKDMQENTDRSIMELVHSENTHSLPEETKEIPVKESADAAGISAESMSAGNQTAEKRKPNIAVIAVILFLLAILGGAGVYYVMQQQNGDGTVRVRKNAGAKSKGKK